MILDHLLELLAVADKKQSLSHHLQDVRLSPPFFWSRSCVALDSILTSVVIIIVATVARRSAPTSKWRPIASAGASAASSVSRVSPADADPSR
jgi:hypothetical protein